VKVVRVECLSRVHLGLILKAFEFGADGVMLLGCEPSMCHFSKDNKCVLDEYEKARGILEMLGIHKDRLVLTRLPAFDGRQFVAGIMNLIERIEQMPSSGHSKLDSSHIQGTKIRSHS
jgi:F420-non-reducing hydrogenase iron-sulfur subunit